MAELSSQRSMLRYADPPTPVAKKALQKGSQDALTYESHAAKSRLRMPDAMPTAVR
jgi:hypothetical protein